MPTERGTMIEIVYVSPTRGDDAADGRSPDTPVRTMERARAVMAELRSDRGVSTILLKAVP